MTRINHHIKTLLSSHDCVIIPNFGAFIANYSPAVVSDEYSTIPGKDILFNRSLTRNDGLLINALIEEQGLDYPKAKQEVERYVISVNTALAKGEKISFEGIGELMLDEAGFVQFIADKSNSCLLDSYGLQPIILDKITEIEHTLTHVEERRTLHRNARAIISAASVAAVVALVFIFTIPWTDKPVGDHASLVFDPCAPEIVTNSTPVNELKERKPLVPPHEVGPVLPQLSIAEKSVPLSTKIAEEKVIPTASHQKAYHIIIASLATEPIAMQYVSAFKRKYDFDSVEIVSGSGRYRISVAHFSQQNEALAFVKTLRLLNPKFDDAWVLPKTLN